MNLIRCSLLALVLFATGAFSGDLAFGPDHLHLSFEEGWYKVNARFADNTRCKKQVRYLPVEVDETLIRLTDPLFYSPPIRLYQSACQADTAIVVNNGARRFPSQVLFIHDGEIARIVEIPLGQGPGEMMQVGNAMLITPHVLVAYGMKKVVAFDLSKPRPIPVASSVLKMGAGVSVARMGQYPGGFVLINDTMDRTSVGKIYGFAIYTLHGQRFLFMRTGSFAYPQDKILLKRPLAAYEKFMKTRRSSYVSNMLSNRITDGFNPFETILLDFNNQALLLLSTKENQILQYTTFDPDRFVTSWYEGDNYFCIPRFDDLAVNFFDQTVWLLNHPKMDRSRHLLPLSRNGRILSDNLQEIDVLNADFTYKETLRLVPPKQFARFIVKAIAVTGSHEMTAIVQLATETDLKNGGRGKSVLTRLRFR